MKTSLISLLIGLSVSLPILGQENVQEDILQENILADEFYTALRHGDRDKVLQMLSDGFRVNDFYQYQNTTIFHTVCYYFYNSQMSDGVRQQCNDIVKVLIDYISPENYLSVDYNFYGEIPIATLTERGFLSLSTLEQLDEAGFRFEDVDDDGSNLLHFVARIGEVSNPELGDIIDYLIERGLDINRPNDAGETPLYIASGVENSSAFYDLLERDANVTLPPSDGSTSLHQAVSLWDLTRTFRLIQAGADVNAADENGRTPLHVATDIQSIDVNLALVFLLIEHGANYNAHDKEGYSPKLQMVEYANQFNKYSRSNRDRDLEDKRWREYEAFMDFIEPLEGMRLERLLSVQQSLDEMELGLGILEALAGGSRNRIAAPNNNPE